MSIAHPLEIVRSFPFDGLFMQQCGRLARSLSAALPCEWLNVARGARATMTDDKLNGLISDAAIAERCHFALAFGYALKGINTRSTPTAYETAEVSAAEARWLLAENTLTAYRLHPPSLRVV